MSWFQPTEATPNYYATVCLQCNHRMQAYSIAKLKRLKREHKTVCRRTQKQVLNTSENQ